MTDWREYSAGACILALSLGLDAELATMVVPPVSDCLGLTAAAICRQPNREAVIPPHIDSTSGTSFMVRL